MTPLTPSDLADPRDDLARLDSPVPMAREHARDALLAAVPRLLATIDALRADLATARAVAGEAEIRGMQRGAAIMEGWSTAEGIREAEKQLADEIAALRSRLAGTGEGG